MPQTPSDMSSKGNNPDLEKQTNELEYAKRINYTLFDISNAVNTTHNLEQLYQSVHNSLNKIMPFPNFFIARYKNITQTINFDYFVDEYDDDFPIIENLNAPNCLTGEVIFTRRPLFLKENMLLERARKKKIVGTIPKTWLGVPLIIQDKVIGVIAVQHYSDPEYFSHKDLEILISVSEQIAIAIERKQILDALEKKEKTLRLITDNTNSIVVFVDANGIFKFTSPAHRFMGYTKKDLSGTSFFDIIHPQDVQPLLQFVEKGITGKESRICLEFRVKNKDGKFKALNGSFDLIKNEDGIMEKLIFIGEDISKQKKAQNALHESEKRFRMIFDTSPDAIIITDIETGRIFDVNNAFEELSGLTKKNLIGEYTTTIGIWKNQEQRSDFISRVKQNGYYKNLEAKLIFKGEPVSTLVSSRFLLVDGRQHLLSIIRDISEHKKLEEQFVLRQKMDATGTLARGIAHDFDNLLSDIMGYLEFLSKDVSHLSKPQQNNISNALTASKKAAELTRQLQTLTKDTNLPKAANKTVLVIDDEDMVRDMAVKALESFGYKTFEAEDGQAGTEIYKQYHNEIDAVLLDIIMPRMSGVETYKQLVKINPEVKVIIASGHITNKEQRKLFIKASAYLDKPYQIMDLKEMLHRILG